MEKQHQSQSGGKGGWLFLGLVLLIYAGTALIDTSLAKQSLLFFGQVLQKVVPVLVLVFALILLLNIFLTPGRVKTYVGTASGWRGWLLAMLGGVLSTGPIYTWYILLGELKQKGMKTALVAVFLYCRAIKLPLLPLLVHYFGMTFTLVLCLYLLAFSILSGVLTELFTNEHSKTPS